MSPDGRGPRACDAPGHPPFAPRRDRRPPDALLSPSPVLSAAGVKPLMPPSGSPVARVHVRVCVPLVAVCPMRAALLGVACLRVFVWPLSVSLVGLGVWYAVEVRPAGYRERCAGACRCVYYCLFKSSIFNYGTPTLEHTPTQSPFRTCAHVRGRYMSTTRGV